MLVGRIVICSIASSSLASPSLVVAGGYKIQSPSLDNAMQAGTHPPLGFVAAEPDVCAFLHCAVFVMGELLKIIEDASASDNGGC